MSSMTRTPNQETSTAADLQARTVIGVFDTPALAEQAIDGLHQAGFPQDEISFIRQGHVPELNAKNTSSGSGAATGMAAGALLGGALGLLALAVPGVGPLLAAGPIAGALVGGAVGGLAGSFAGLSVPDADAQDYEAAIRAGAAVVGLRALGQEQTAQAEQLLRKEGARQVTSYLQVL